MIACGWDEKSYLNLYDGKSLNNEKYISINFITEVVRYYWKLSFMILPLNLLWVVAKGHTFKHTKHVVKNCIFCEFIRLVVHKINLVISTTNIISKLEAFINHVRLVGGVTKNHEILGKRGEGPVIYQVY